MPYAYAEDVEAEWGTRFSIPDIEKVEALIGKAERRIRSFVDIEVRILNGLTTSANVKDAIVSMVIRVLRNPGGYRQQATGPFSATLDRAVASGRLEITLDERRLLGMISGAGSVAVNDPALSDLSIRPDEVWP